MSITDELRKLADLRAEGHLSDQEFAEAKRRLLDEGAGIPPLHESEIVPEKRFRSSHWSSGNFFFPDSILLANDGIVFRKGAFFGSSEEHINYRSVASIRVQNGIFLATVSVETSGGSQPIRINGLWKSEAREVQDAIRARQRGA